MFTNIIKDGSAHDNVVSLNTDGHVKSLNGSSDEFSGDDAF